MIDTLTQRPASVALDLADVLHERAQIAMCLFVRAVREVGPDIAYDLAARALFLEATGGLQLGAPFNRKRTPGGIFFYLLKETIDDEQHLRIFQRVRRPRADVSEPIAEVSELKPVAPVKLIPVTPPTRPCAQCGQQADVVGKFHFGPTGKRCICGPCTDAGYVFGPVGVVMQRQEQAA